MKFIPIKLNRKTNSIFTLFLMLLVIFLFGNVKFSQAVVFAPYPPDQINCPMGSDGCYATSTNALYISWVNSQVADPVGHELSYYEIAVSTVPGDDSHNVYDWAITTSTSDFTFEPDVDFLISLADIEATNTPVIYVKVRGVDAHDDRGLITVSDAITVDLTAAATDISATKILDESDYDFTPATSSIQVVLYNSSGDVNKIYYQLVDSGDFYEYIIGNPFTLSEDGDYQFRWYGIDKAGNIEDITNNEKDFYIDSQSPVSHDLIYKTNGLSASSTVASSSGAIYDLGTFQSTTTLESMSINIADPHTGLSNTSLYKNGVVVGVFVYDSGAGDGTWNLSSISEDIFTSGLNTLIANFSDAVGNTRQVTIKANVAYEFLGGNFSVPEGSTSTSTDSISSVGDNVLTVFDGTGTSTINIASGTSITRIDSLPFDATALLATTTNPSSLTGLGTGEVVEGAIHWGLNNIGLTFNPAINLSIYVGDSFNGQTLDVKRSLSGSSGWTSDGIVAPKTCLVASGICSFSATNASFYAATKTTTTNQNNSSSSGGGGVATLYTSSNCQMVKYSEWGSCVSGLKYREILSSEPSSCTLTAEQIASQTASCTVTIIEQDKNPKPVITNNPKIKPQVLGVKIYADGTLLRGLDKKIYIVKNKIAVRIYTLKELLKLPLQKIYSVDDLTLVWHGVDNVLVRLPNKRIYYIYNGETKPIFTLIELRKLVGKKIYDIDEAYFESLKNR